MVVGVVWFGWVCKSERVTQASTLNPQPKPSYRSKPLQASNAALMLAEMGDVEGAEGEMRKIARRWVIKDGAISFLLLLDGAI